jgi:hypothetical protein
VSGLDEPHLEQFLQFEATVIGGKTYVHGAPLHSNRSRIPRQDCLRLYFYPSAE